MKFLDEFISEYTFQDIVDLESRDEQFLALKAAWGEIVTQFGDQPLVRQVFLYLVIQNALVSYQIAGSGPLWRSEFADFLVKDFQILVDFGADNQKWRTKVLKNS